MSFIVGIGTAVPKNKFEQSVISSFMERLATNEEQRRKIKTVFRASSIQSRHSVLDDYGKQNNYVFFPNNEDLSPFPSTSQRMELYRKHALGLSIQAIENLKNQVSFKSEEITHLITVSCTGMYAPGLDIDLVAALGLSYSVNRICINFMGCFAAINAIKTADAFCKTDTKAKVLVVCTELCSLHFQKDFTDDNILANALFADGSAALLIQSSNQYSNTLSIDGFHSDIAFNGSNDMAWSIGNLGFEMKLSTYVPEILGKGIQALVDGLKKKTDVALINHYVIHPGGKKILDVIADVIQIPKGELDHCYTTLQNFGNMSSPTILFVLKDLLKKDLVTIGNTMMGMAFGPGLTMESMMLRKSN